MIFISFWSFHVSDLELQLCNFLVFTLQVISTVNYTKTIYGHYQRPCCLKSDGVGSSHTAAAAERLVG